MSESLRGSAPAGRRGPVPSSRAPSLSRVVYRSRSIGTPTPHDLQSLTQAAQSRNQRESITGVMLYDDRRYFQWLEGPPDGVDRLMASICNDRRHTDIEILSSQPAPARTFANWSMKLATPDHTSVFREPDVIVPPAEVVETLRRQPEEAPMVLVRLQPFAETSAPEPRTPAGLPPGYHALDDGVSRLPLQALIADILRGVMQSAVIPSLAAAKAGRPQDMLPPAHRRSAELADLLINADQAAAIELIKEINAGGASISGLYAKLFEPAARVLGDLWDEDICSEFDVTLGLCRLQAASRLLAADTLAKLPSGAPLPAVLIVPGPGELHRLGASLDTDVLWQAGWAPKVEFPTDNQSLQDLLSSSWVDVLDLSLSTAFRRDSQLPQIAETIAQARRASQNPALVVVVGGRVFYERGSDGEAVGADHATRSAAHVDQVILQTMATTSTTQTLTPEVSVS